MRLLAKDKRFPRAECARLKRGWNGKTKQSLESISDCWSQWKTHKAKFRRKKKMGEKTVISARCDSEAPVNFCHWPTCSWEHWLGAAHLFLFCPNEPKQLSRRCCLQNSASELCLNSAAVLSCSKVFPLQERLQRRAICCCSSFPSLLLFLVKGWRRGCIGSYFEGVQENVGTLATWNVTRRQDVRTCGSHFAQSAGFVPCFLVTEWNWVQLHQTERPFMNDAASVTTSCPLADQTSDDLRHSCSKHTFTLWRSKTIFISLKWDQIWI